MFESSRPLCEPETVDRIENVPVAFSHWAVSIGPGFSNSRYGSPTP